MAESFLKRTDVTYPARPNARGIYAVKHLEDNDPDTLQTLVNAYLLSLPEATASWSPHVPDIQFYHTGNGGGARHHAWVTIFAVGTVTVSPTG